MKYLIPILFLVSLAGCSWDEVEQGSTATQAVSEKVQMVGAAVSPYTGGYGGLVATVAGAIGTAAGAFAAFAKAKKAKQLAAAAVEAADETQGGGQALVNAAVSNGVGGEIRAAYKSK